ncbi:ADP-ribosylglycohydrolase family protein [Streptomyces himalayensis]|uniref:ADP-ribosylglycohydrolase family protein n=1 Tax=Streptomyces himalayensis TaxID=2820085 RepID=UPI00215DA1C4|nr:ADP-ribosylglycohydrolase family protein [Streptomyces himalayensis]
MTDMDVPTGPRGRHHPPEGDARHAGTTPATPEADGYVPDGEAASPGGPAGPRRAPDDGAHVTDGAPDPDPAPESKPAGPRRAPADAPVTDVAPADAVPVTGIAPAVDGASVPNVARPPVRRIEGLLLGLSAGDAAGWPAARHRAARMPEWTRRLTRELDTFAEENATTTLPVPIALNQPPEPLRLGPSDDAEWAAFAAGAVLCAADSSALGDLGSGRRMRAAIDLSWNALASEVAAAADRAPEVESAVLQLRARISVRAGLGNLATGLRPPATGHDNPHYFDDAACVRACVLAVAHPGDPEEAADLAEFDARYTQDGDGVHGARAMAAAVAAALGGADVDTCVDAALAQLPEPTEVGRNARHALKLAGDANSAFGLVPLLEHQIVDHVYSYGIAAAETVPVALALVSAARGRLQEAVPAAACLSRVADSAPALAGALAGALGGGDAVPAAWRDACRTLPGCALPRLTGTDLVELAEHLAHTELTGTEG